MEKQKCHCEEQSDEAISVSYRILCEENNNE